jgi:5-methylcytosine-specific restriction endonuclease McrA
VVRDASGAYHLQNDANEKVEFVTGASNGEFWRITTDDGTQYHEPGLVFVCTPVGTGELAGTHRTARKNLGAGPVPIDDGGARRLCHAVAHPRCDDDRPDRLVGRRTDWTVISPDR